MEGYNEVPVSNDEQAAGGQTEVPTTIDGKTTAEGLPETIGNLPTDVPTTIGNLPTETKPQESPDYSI